MAQAVYEIRQLVSSYLGSENEGDPVVRRAAHLAYALHNEALAVLENRTFDCEKAVESRNCGRMLVRTILLTYSKSIRRDEAWQVG